MENSEEKSMSKALSSVAPEESGWTFYFEEFLCQNDEQEMSRRSPFSGNESPNSLVSDATSSAAVKKPTNIQDQARGAPFGRSCKKLSFKKRKTKGVVTDDALEDTASSPVNSPKVSYFNQMEMKKKNKEILEISEEKVAICEQKDKRSEFNSIGERDNNNMELKKRGLCLVSLSSLANYLS